MAEAKVRLLLVEDEQNVGTTLTERLVQEGFEVSWAKTASEAKGLIAKGGFQLALLDVGLPDGSGFDIGTAIRASAPQTALMFLTAFGSPEDRVKGLELGAEDYIVKPFHFRELLLRIQNVLKRAEAIRGLAAGPVQIGRAQVHFERFEVEVDGRRIALTHKECSVLRLLYQKQNQVVSRDEILNQAWSEDEFPTSRTVDNFIVRLRKLIETDPENPRVIKSVRGVGYQLERGK
jgi:two-component system alkaline phosphatase synthesis response regulator PhoP